MTEYLRTGVVTEPHGVRGAVKVYPTTDDVTRFEQYGELVVERTGKTPEESGAAEVRTVESVQYQKDRVILKLSGISDRNEAETLRRAELYVHRSRTAPPKEGEHFTADLYGLRVVTEDGETLGTLTDVMKTGANDVFSVKRPDGRELLLPNIPDCIRNVDLDAGTMTVFLMPGLADL